MSNPMQLGNVTVNVERKAIKHIHLSVLPPAGRVRMSAPLHVSAAALHAFAALKLPWIREQQRRLLAQPRETPREYLDRESHFVWGHRYLLRQVVNESGPLVDLRHSELVLRVRPGWTRAHKHAALQAWYRDQVAAALPEPIAKWERALGVKAGRIFVRHMKTRWGSCTPGTRNLRFNTELAKKPRECLEYVVLHELAHLIVPTHGPRYVAILDRHMPNWRSLRQLLDNLPVRDEQENVALMCGKSRDLCQNT